MITKDQAQEHLDAWLAADKAVSTGQSYTIDGMTLTRVDSEKIRESISYWATQLKAAEEEEAGTRSPVALAAWQ